MIGWGDEPEHQYSKDINWIETGKLLSKSSEQKFIFLLFILVKGEHFPRKQKTTNKEKYVRKIVSKQGYASIKRLINLSIKVKVVKSSEISKVEYLSVNNYR